MSEFITIQVGQCGNQIGHALWPLILDEYQITQVPDGIIRDGTQKSDINEGFHSFFHVPETAKTDIKTYWDLKQQKIKARAVIIDMEESVVRHFRTGPLNHIFQGNRIVSNYHGSANNWAEGHFEHGPTHKDKILSTLQSEIEKCDSLHGFIMVFSTGGGTGSGLGTYTLQLLDDYYPEINRFVCPVYPSGTEDVITTPYNGILATEQLVKHASCVFPIENRSLAEIVNTLAALKSKESMKYMQNCKPFQDMNSIVVNMLLHLTSGARFPGNLNLDMSDIATNMVPFPNLHYLSSSYSPLTLSAIKTSGPVNNKQLLENMYNGVLNPNNQLVKLNLLDKEACFMGATFQGRGALTISDMRYFVQKLQSRGNFTPWSKSAIKLGLCTTPPVGHDQSLFGIFNTSSMVNLYENCYQQFKKLYRRKAHLHHYYKIDGFEDDHFKECKETIKQCISVYRNITNINPVERPRFQVL